MVDVNCGGCRGEGAHKRWCAQVVGRHASLRGNWSERAEALADEVGANDPGAANVLYKLAGQFKTEALALAEDFKEAKWR